MNDSINALFCGVIAEITPRRATEGSLRSDRSAGYRLTIFSKVTAERQQ
jgi:hypothetical protein